MNLTMADIFVVKELCEHLTKALDDFCNKKAAILENVEYIDAFMAAHNFHKAIVLDLEERTGLTFLRQIAVDTFTQAMAK